MSGARFARTGRFRFFAGFFILLLLIGVMAMLHSSSLQCEQNIETLRKRVEIAMEQKHQVERVQEQESNDHLESKRNLEEKLREQKEQHEKELLDARMSLEKLQQTHEVLVADHKQLVNECAKNKKQQLDDANSLEKKMQALRTELQKAKNLQENEIALWKEKYNVIVEEKLQLENRSNQSAQAQRVKLLESIVAEFSSHCLYKPKTIVADLVQQQIKKPLNSQETTHNSAKSGAVQMPSFDKPESEKSFKVQESVSPGFYHIPIKVSNATQKTNKETNINFKLNKNNNNNLLIKQTAINGDVAVGEGVGDGDDKEKNQKKILPLPFSAQNNRSLILNSVENFQIVPKPLKKISDEENQETQLKQQPENEAAAGAAIVGKVSPLSAPRKLTSTQSAKSGQRVLEQANNNINNSSTSSSTSLPPLPLPPNQRKQLPAMVAPIPEFDQLLKNEANQQQEQQQQESPKKSKLERDTAADVDAAIEQQNDGNDAGAADQGTNNRYANVVNDMEAKASQKKLAKVLPIPHAGVGDGDGVEDSGAREVKDNEVLVNDANFNLQADEDDNNFFDNNEKNPAGGDVNLNNVDDIKHNNNNNKNDDENDDNDDDDLGLGLGNGDIAVKNQHLLEADSLNNEVAGDQGKEPPDALHLEEDHDEDEDEDEYANPVARQQGAQAIRN